MIGIFILILVIGGIILFSVLINKHLISLAKEKRRMLLSKYGDENIVNNILERRIWQGAKSDHIIDMLGYPIDIDKHVLKTRKRETWKYNQIGKRRFSLHIIFDNDIVVGWDDKT